MMRRLHTIALCLTASLAFLPTRAGADWRELGPSPIAQGSTGRLTDVAPHPTDPDIVYIAAASGGVWRYDNGNWTPLTDHMPASAIGALALDPNDPDVLYAGSGEANGATHSFYGVGLYKSIDAGATWEILGEDEFAGRAFARILVSPVDGNVLFAATRSAGDPKGHPQANGPIGVWHSLDGGVTWTLLGDGMASGEAGDLAMDPNDPDVVYAGVFGDVYRSMDGGGTWTRVLDVSGGRVQIVVAPTNSQRLWTLSSNGTARRSDDQGDSWTTMDPEIYLQGGYDIAVAVDPDNEDIAFFGGVPVSRTDDAGQSFDEITPPHVDIHRFARDADGRLLCANDGGLHRSSNNGDSWDVLNLGLGVIQFYPGLSIHPTDPDWMIGGLQDNGTVLRHDDSMFWDVVMGADGGYTAVHPDNPDVVFAQGQGTGSLGRSTDGGVNFDGSSDGINEDDPNAFHSPIVFHPDDPATVYYATNRIYRSTNTGDFWVDISDILFSTDAIRAMAIAPSNPDRIYVASRERGIYASEDGGENFTRVLDYAPGWVRTTRELAVAPWDDQMLFVGVRRFGANQVGMTPDAGETWEALDGDLPDVPVNSVAAAEVGANRFVFAATDRGVWVTCTMGEHWGLMGEAFPNVPTTDIQYDDRLTRVVVATMGRGVWTFDDATEAALLEECMPEDGTGTGTDSGGTTSTPGSSSGGSGDTTTPGPGSSSSDPDGATDSGDTGAEESGGEATEDGCGCRASGGAQDLVWLLLPVAAWRRRRR
jgi:photosystem II stability/assembly factor-like uncharacterized protein